jgi:hypothetical protein
MRCQPAPNARACFCFRIVHPQLPPFGAVASVRTTTKFALMSINRTAHHQFDDIRVRRPVPAAYRNGLALPHQRIAQFRPRNSLNRILKIKLAEEVITYPRRATARR